MLACWANNPSPPPINIYWTGLGRGSPTPSYPTVATRKKGKWRRETEITLEDPFWTFSDFQKNFNNNYNEGEEKEEDDNEEEDNDSEGDKDDLSVILFGLVGESFSICGGNFYICWFLKKDLDFLIFYYFWIFRWKFWISLWFVCISGNLFGFLTVLCIIAWVGAAEGREGRSQTGPKGPKPAQRATN